MIDIDKYEGHQEGPWWCDEDDWRCIDTMIKHEKGEDLEEICRVFYREVDYNGKALPNGPVGFNKATAQLIADAPLLLAEVKRLRGVIAKVWDLMQNSNHQDREMFFWGFDGKNTGWMKVHEELAMKELNWGEEE